MCTLADLVFNRKSVQKGKGIIGIETLKTKKNEPVKAHFL